MSILGKYFFTFEFDLDDGTTWKDTVELYEDNLKKAYYIAQEELKKKFDGNVIEWWILH